MLRYMLDTDICINAPSELYFGVEKSARPDNNLKVRAALHTAGQPISPYDLMIAGHARSMGLVLVTHNTREFGRVPGLLVEDSL